MSAGVPGDGAVVVELWRIAAEMAGDEIRARATSARAGEQECPEQSATSVSHTRGLTVFACAPVRVGVDVELVREHPHLDRLARRAMTDAEWSRWRAGPDRTRAFTQHWTRVEAYLKAIGVGVRGGLRTRPAGSWTVLDLDLGDAHCGALAVEAAGRAVQVVWRVLPVDERA